MPNNFLVHYGVSNQKHGHRRWQNKDGSLTPEGRIHYGVGPPRKKSKEQNPNHRTKIVADVVEKNRNTKVGGTKEAVVSSVALAAFLAPSIAIVAKNLRDMHVEKRMQSDADYRNKVIDKEIAKANADSMKPMSSFATIRDFSDDNPPKKIVGKHSIEDDVAAINPIFDKKYVTGKEIIGARNNCVLCSATYDLRRRGYDVTSKITSDPVYVSQWISRLYDGDIKADIAYVNTDRAWEGIGDHIASKYPEGSRGIVTLSSPSLGIGHAMAWEIEKGKLRVIDAQCNDSDVSLVRSSRSCEWRSASFIRTDNLKVKMDSVSAFSAELKSDWKQTTDRGQKGANNFLEKYKKEHPGTKMSDSEIKNLYFYKNNNE